MENKNIIGYIICFGIITINENCILIHSAEKIVLYKTIREALDAIRKLIQDGGFQELNEEDIIENSKKMVEFQYKGKWLRPCHLRYPEDYDGEYEPKYNKFLGNYPLITPVYSE